MAEYVRKCLKCGATDPKEHWSSLDQASEKGAFEREWACPNCSWTEFDVVRPEDSRTAETARA